jgi:hypothetical protein
VDFRGPLAKQIIEEPTHMNNPVTINDEQKAATRKAYTSPELVEHGSIQDLTAGKVTPNGAHDSGDVDDEV